MNGLKILVDSYKDKIKGRISLNIVYTPPYSMKKLYTISEYIKKLSWINSVNIRITYPEPGSIQMLSVSQNDLKEDKDLIQWGVEIFRNNYEETDQVAKSTVELKLARLMQRPVFKKPIDNYFLNGCCLPGERRVFVSTNGNFHVCEKIPNTAPTIGNIYDGLDFDAIRKFYIEDYANNSLQLCSKCWAIRHCALCYVKAFDVDGKFNIKKKTLNCNLYLLLFQKLLEYFGELMEENPQGLNYLYDIDIV